MIIVFTQRQQQYLARLQDRGKAHRDRLLQYINLQLIANGQPAASAVPDYEFADVARGLLDQYRTKTLLLSDYRCPIDSRIEAFIARYFADVKHSEPIRLPNQTLVVDRHGMARELALPADHDEFHSNIINSYRVRNGVLHNPRHDRRTTQGTFHIAEGGLPIPGDKRAVPKQVFAELLRRALDAPEHLLRLPFTSSQSEEAISFVSLLIFLN